MKKALLIIDIQEAYLAHRRADQDYRRVMETINAAAAQFRQANLPVFVVRDLSEGSGNEFRNVRELQAAPTDLEVLKVYNNAFWKTELDDMLRERNVDWVLLCGNAAEFCVTATYFGALENGYAAYLLKDGILAETETGLASLEQVRPLLTNEQLSGMLAE